MSRPHLALLVPSLLAASLSGCHSYLVPFDERPLIAPQPVATASGLRLDVDPRSGLQVRPAAGDLSAVLGVGLESDGEGLVVTHRLRPDARLRPDDRIAGVAAALPRVGEELAELHRKLLQHEVASGPSSSLQLDPATGSPGEGGPRHPLDEFEPSMTQKSLEPPPVPTPAELKARASAHPVRTVGDLRPYLIAPGAALDLLVLRGGQEVVVRVPLIEPHRWLPVRLWAPHLTRWHGIDLARVGDLAPEHQPVGAKARDFLVVRVARDAPAGRAGLRPLDVVPEAEVVGLLGGGQEVLLQALRPRDVDEARVLMERREQGAPLPLDPEAYVSPDGDLLRTPNRVPVRVRAPDGTIKGLVFEPRQPDVELWFPFLFAYHSDGSRTHLGFGPLDLLFHHSSKIEYDPESDSYGYVTRWSFGTSIQGGGVTRERGTDAWGGMNPFVDGTRADYLFDWLDVPDETLRRRGW